MYNVFIKTCESMFTHIHQYVYICTYTYIYIYACKTMCIVIAELPFPHGLCCGSSTSVDPPKVSCIYKEHICVCKYKRSAKRWLQQTN